jgi:hypothetical protein
MSKLLLSLLCIPVSTLFDLELYNRIIANERCLGIAWFAVEGNPILFELVGLGMGVRP